MSRVFVGMSGGVDSSLTAAMLVEQGYDVTGVYMKNWTRDLPGMQCPWAEDLADAKRVAVQLGIPFKVYDFEAEYRHKVVDYMLAEYAAGRTPNPDVMCNQEVKFKLFLDTSLADGADMIATGHYAGVERDIDSVISDAPTDKTCSAPDASGLATLNRKDSVLSVDTLVNGGSRLLRAVDSNKDQTYFLYRISSQALSKTLFPLGGFEKTQVRQMAAKRGLLTATRKESMGICFVGSVGIKEFLGEFIEAVPGKIIDRDDGNIIGDHDGAVYYTLGQRHGLNLGGGLPYYVVGKDMAQNVVYVSRNLNDASMWRKRIRLTDMHWINGEPDDDRVEVRLRHRGNLLQARLSGEGLDLFEPERAIAAGQSAVIYQGNVCLGGGIVS